MDRSSMRLRAIAGRDRVAASAILSSGQRTLARFGCQASNSRRPTPCHERVPRRVAPPGSLTVLPAVAAHRHPRPERVTPPGASMRPSHEGSVSSPVMELGHRGTTVEIRESASITGQGVVPMTSVPDPMRAGATAVAERNATSIRPFTFEVPDEELSRPATPHQRDQMARPGDGSVPGRSARDDPGAGRLLGDGVRLAHVEQRFAALPHFVTEIDGVDIHFIHVRSKHEDALPSSSRTAGPARRSSS